MGKMKSPLGGIAKRRALLPGKKVVSSFALNRAQKTLVSVAERANVSQRSNIKVVVRVRPPNARESTASSRVVVHAVDSHMVLFDPPGDDGQDFYFKGVRQNYHQGKRNRNVKFAFDNVYAPSSATEDIFQEVINPMLDTLLSGYNCSVFAYGATGSGKTYTMIGNKDNPGLTYKTVMELYRRLETMENDYESEVVVSYLEVYNETVRDLLETTNTDLQVREDPNGVIVANLSNHKPRDSADLLDLLARGNSVRSQHPTDHNAESSRSHAVFQVCIRLRSRCTELTSKYKSAKLVMVDLAGSEKGAATGFQGQRFREGASINRSLLSLGNCINALADGKKHIPYRDSKLTRILKDSLGGNCKTVMIANVSPSSLSYDDSYNTLRYADRAKRIKCQLKTNTMSVSACLTQYTKIVEEMRSKIDRLEKELQDANSKLQTCCCNRSRIDAWTETCSHSPTNLPPSSTASHRMQSAPLHAVQSENINPLPLRSQVVETTSTVKEVLTSPIPENIVLKIIDLTKKQQDVVKKMCESNAAALTAATKVGTKELRIKSIQKLKSSTEQANVLKLQKQIDPLLQRRQDALSKQKDANSLLNKIQSELQSIKNQYSEALTQPMPSMNVADFFGYQSLKVDSTKLATQVHNFKNLSVYYLEEWQRSENLLSDATEQLSSTYLTCKYYQKNTKNMDLSYDKFVSNLCGTKVQWQKDVSDVKGSRVPPLRELLHASMLENIWNEDPGADGDRTFVVAQTSPETTGVLPVSCRGRVATPPKPVGFDLEMEVEDDNEEMTVDSTVEDGNVTYLEYNYSLLSASSKENIY